MELKSIDDGNILSTEFPLGSRLCSDGKIRVVEDKIESDRDVSGDKRTAELYLEIANQVSDFIQLMVNYPSLHCDTGGFMPILDLQVKVERNQCTYKFYKKKVSNPLLMLESSAMPMKVKRTCMVQEGLRRLRNTRRDLPWNQKVEILSEFHTR